MAISRNGWDVYASGSHSKLVSFPWITGKVRNGDHYVVLDYIAKRWNAEVEAIRKDWSWGYANRAVRGASVISEHATGTAVDFNAPLHPLGKKNTFSAGDRAKIRQIMKDVSHAARWGGEWSRPDDMHVELIGGNALIGRVADQIRAGKLPGDGGAIKPVASNPKPVSKPKPAKAKGTDENRSIQTALKTMGLKVGVIDGVNGPMQKAAVKAFQKHHNLVQDGNWGPVTQKAFTLNKAVQQALRDEGYTKQTVDGYYGDQTAANVRDYQRRVGLAVDGLAGPKTLKKLGVK